MDTFDLTGLTFEQVQRVYNDLSISFAPVIYLAIVLGMILAILTIMGYLKLNLNGEGNKEGLTSADFFVLVVAKWRYLFFLLFLPVGFNLLDALIGAILGGFNDLIGAPEGNAMSALFKSLGIMNAKEPSIWDLSVLDLIDYTISLGVQPFIILIDQWVYGLALIFRFFFLGILKMTSGIAFACLLHEKTQGVFITWMKGLIICYLLIPCFLFANAFMEAFKVLYITEKNFAWLTSLLIIVVVGKALLFASSKVILWRIL